MPLGVLVGDYSDVVEQEVDRRGICQSRLISSIVGGAIFMACVVCGEQDQDGSKLVATVSAASGAADATIREVCKTLYIYRDRILPVCYIGHDASMLLF
jgi:hypothetical protein